MIRRYAIIEFSDGTHSIMRRQNPYKTFKTVYECEKEIEQLVIKNQKPYVMVTVYEPEKLPHEKQ